MLIPTLIMAAIAVILGVVAYYQDGDQHIVGMRVSYKMMIEVLPLLLIALVVAGMAQVLAEEYQSFISEWLGPQSGLRGILIGSMLGTLTPGGPVVTVPILAGLLRSGSSVGVAVAYLTGWGLWSLDRLPLEIGLLGWKFTVIRIVSVCLLAPIAGLIAQTLFAESI